jgi:hypothetical protein
MRNVNLNEYLSFGSGSQYIYHDHDDQSVSFELVDRESFRDFECECEADNQQTMLRHRNRVYSLLQQHRLDSSAAHARRRNIHSLAQPAPGLVKRTGACVCGLIDVDSGSAAAADHDHENNVAPQLQSTVQLSGSISIAKRTWQRAYASQFPQVHAHAQLLRSRLLGAHAQIYYTHT